jgi:hypothetical protein
MGHELTHRGQLASFHVTRFGAPRMNALAVGAVRA